MNANDHFDNFVFDDLLVSCTKEIITNGMESQKIPRTIKDWLAGKVLSSLPKRLIQKLFSFLLDNRDLSDLVGYKENGTGEEFTFMLYKSKAQKVRLTNQTMSKNNEESINLYDNTGVPKTSKYSNRIEMGIKIDNFFVRKI